MSGITLRVGQSADPDDAFMAWALARQLEAEGVAVDLTFEDIETLNRGAIDGAYDMTAISVGVYPRIADHYRMMRCGGSFGDRYGPVVISRRPAPQPGAEALRGLRVAIPGEHTTAFLLLRLYAGDDFEPVPMAFDTILAAVDSGDVDAGLVIHEAQLVYERLGLHAWFEPAERWADEESLPLPLGVVAVRRGLAEELQGRLAEAFFRSIRAAFEQPEAALDFAAGHARGLARDDLQRYVHRYVDASTLDMGPAGARAIETLFQRAVEAGVLATPPPLDLL